MTRLVSAAVLSGCIILGWAPGAAAAPVISGSLTITPPVEKLLYPGCSEYRYAYSVLAPSVDWDVAVSVTDASGGQHSNAQVLDAGAASAAGTQPVRLCGAGIDDPGTYTITAVLTWRDSGLAPTVEPALVVPFTLGKPASRTALAASPVRPEFNQVVSFRVRSTGQRRLGYTAAAGTRVRLELSVEGRWRRIDSATSDAEGRTVFRYRWDTFRPTLRLRAVTVTTGSLQASVSEPVTIRLR